MKKLFVLIFILTLSTNAFSWGGMFCDEFLDARQSNDKPFSVINRAAFDFFVYGHLDLLPNDRELLLPLVVEDPPVSYNQMLYLIEKECSRISENYQ